jgi:hypothetical protein
MLFSPFYNFFVKKKEKKPENELLIINDLPLKKKKEKRSKKKKLLIYTGICSSISIVLLLFITYIIFIFNFNDQLRISYADTSSNNIYVTWTTSDKIKPFVSYKIMNESEKIVLGTSDRFEKAKFIYEYINRVKLEDLDFNTKYNYEYGFVNRDNKYIKTQDENYEIMIPENPLIINKNYNQQYLLYGDLGAYNNRILKTIKNLKNIDTIFHLGDLAYDLDSYFGLMGNLFFSQVKKMASTIPYMTVPGNHESGFNFAHYKNRLTMPNYQNTHNMYYSVELKNLKVLCFSSEAYYYSNQDDIVKKQKLWLENELSQINRTIFPWVITMAHRPMYCSNNNEDDCVNFKRDKVRLDLEELFYKYNVTIEFWAHEHSYERTCPLLNGSCSYFKNVNNYFLNPIHITTGAGGCVEGIENFVDKYANWSVVRVPEYGYGILNINYTYLKWEQYSINNDRNVFLSDRLILSNNFL